MGKPHMKHLHLAICLAALLLRAVSASSQSICGTPELLTQVEIAGPEFSLADLFAPGARPGLVQDARRIRMGTTPLMGSPRVFSAEQVQVYLDRLAKVNPSSVPPCTRVSVPSRITVVRAGAVASCADVEAILSATTDSRSALEPESSHAKATPYCGAGNRISRDAALTAIKKSWDPASQTWQATARCMRAIECVPFLVSVASDEAPRSGPKPGTPVGQSATQAVTPALARAPKTALVAPLLRAGAKVELLWDRAGIRMSIPAICLESGAVGETVRTRLLHGGRILPAVIVNERIVRSIS